MAERGVGAPSALVLAVHRAHRGTHQLDVDVVRVHLDLDPHADDAVPVHLAALAAQQAGRLVHRGVVGVRGQRDRPLPQFHTPTGTETTATPNTRSSGSHPAACSSSASSTERSEVMPRSFDGGAATASDWAPLSISARTSWMGAAPPSALRLTRAAPSAAAARPGRSP